MPYKYNPFTSNLDLVEDISGLGTVTSFSFTDANGFDGTVTNPTTTPNLTLTTTVADTRVMFSNSGAITGDAEMTYNSTTNVLSIANLTANGNLKQSITTSQSAFDSIEMTATNGGIRIQSGGAGSTGDILVNAAAGSLNLVGAESVTNAISLNCTTGGIEVVAALGTRLQSSLAFNPSAISSSPSNISPSHYFWTVDTGSGNITVNLPAGDSGRSYIIYHLAGANNLVLTANGTELIRMGNTISSAGGTATSNSVGNCISITYNTSTTTWLATSFNGFWTLA